MYICNNHENYMIHITNVVVVRLSEDDDDDDVVTNIAAKTFV